MSSDLGWNGKVIEWDFVPMQITSLFYDDAHFREGNKTLKNVDICQNLNESRHSVPNGH